MRGEFSFCVGVLVSRERDETVRAEIERDGKTKQSAIEANFGGIAAGGAKAPTPSSTQSPPEFLSRRARSGIGR